MKKDRQYYLDVIQSRFASEAEREHARAALDADARTQQDEAMAQLLGQMAEDQSLTGMAKNVAKGVVRKAIPIAAGVGAGIGTGGLAAVPVGLAAGEFADVLLGQPGEQAVAALEGRYRPPSESGIGSALMSAAPMAVAAVSPLAGAGLLGASFAAGRWQNIRQVREMKEAGLLDKNHNYYLAEAGLQPIGPEMRETTNPVQTAIDIGFIGHGLQQAALPFVRAATAVPPSIAPAPARAPNIAPVEGMNVTPFIQQMQISRNAAARGPVTNAPTPSVIELGPPIDFAAIGRAAQQADAAAAARGAVQADAMLRQNAPPTLALPFLPPQRGPAIAEAMPLMGRVAPPMERAPAPDVTSGQIIPTAVADVTVGGRPQQIVSPSVTAPDSVAMQAAAVPAAARPAFLDRIVAPQGTQRAATPMEIIRGETAQPLERPAMDVPRIETGRMKGTAAPGKMNFRQMPISEKPEIPWETPTARRMMSAIRQLPETLDVAADMTRAAELDKASADMLIRSIEGATPKQKRGIVSLIREHLGGGKTEKVEGPGEITELHAGIPIDRVAKWAGERMTAFLDKVMPDKSASETPRNRAASVGSVASGLLSALELLDSPINILRANGRKLAKMGGAAEEVSNRMLSTLDDVQARSIDAENVFEDITRPMAQARAALSPRSKAIAEFQGESLFTDPNTWSQLPPDLLRFFQAKRKWLTDMREQYSIQSRFGDEYSRQIASKFVDQEMMHAALPTAIERSLAWKKASGITQMSAEDSAILDAMMKDRNKAAIVKSLVSRINNFADEVVKANPGVERADMLAFAQAMAQREMGFNLEWALHPDQVEKWKAGSLQRRSLLGGYGMEQEQNILRITDALMHQYHKAFVSQPTNDAILGIVTDPQTASKFSTPALTKQLLDAYNIHVGRYNTYGQQSAFSRFVQTWTGVDTANAPMPNQSATNEIMRRMASSILATPRQYAREVLTPFTTVMKYGRGAADLDVPFKTVWQSLFNKELIAWAESQLPRKGMTASDIAQGKGAISEVPRGRIAGGLENVIGKGGRQAVEKASAWLGDSVERSQHHSNVTSLIGTVEMLARQKLGDPPKAKGGMWVDDIAGLQQKMGKDWQPMLNRARAETVELMGRARNIGSASAFGTAFKDQGAIGAFLPHMMRFFAGFGTRNALQILHQMESNGTLTPIGLTVAAALVAEAPFVYEKARKEGREPAKMDFVNGVTNSIGIGGIKSGFISSVYDSVSQGVQGNPKRLLQMTTPGVKFGTDVIGFINPKERGKK